MPRRAAERALRLASLPLPLLLMLTSGCGKRPAEPPVVVSVRPPDGATPIAEKAPGPTSAGYPFRRSVLLSVGVNQYPGLSNLPDLKFAEADARGVSEVFETLYGFEVVSLYGAAAKKRDIERELKRLTGEVGEEDVLVVYFAGHGAVIPVEDGLEAGFLIPADADLDGKNVRDKAQLGGAGDRHGDGDAFRRGERRRHVLVIADACCSGFMATRGRSPGPTSSRFCSAARGRYSRRRIKIRARASGGRRKHGYFSAVLLDELRKGEAQSVIDLYLPILHRVAQETNGNMTPRLGHLGDGDGMFVFIPKSIPRSEIEADLSGRTLSDASTGLARVALRQRERTARMTTEAEVYQAMTVPHYAQSVRAEEARQDWERRFAVHGERETRRPVGARRGPRVLREGAGDGSKPGRGLPRARELAGLKSLPGAGSYFLAECFRLGFGVKANDEAANRLYRQAGEKGFFPAEFFAAEATVQKPKLVADEAAKIKLIFDRGRERKYPPAVTRLANLHTDPARFGGVAEDLPKALSLYQEAADLGDTQAMIALFEICATDHDKLPKDIDRAERSSVRAAELGSAKAQFLLALEYRPNGTGRKLQLKTSNQEAFRWAKPAAEQGLASAAAAI